MAAKMASSRSSGLSRAAWGKRIFTRQNAWALAAAIVVVAVSAALWWRTSRNSQPPDELLAQAYSENRTLELRFANARHARLRARRGPENRPLALIEAEAFIGRGLEAHPRDWAWIQAKGRADLLAWNYASAIKNFTEAHKLRPDSPEVLTDLASAYFEQAEATNHALDYRNALDYLGMVLQAKPDDLDALFNHALISERVNLMEAAINDWQHYLRLDPSSEWSSEARDHLAEISKKKENTK